MNGFSCCAVLHRGNYLLDVFDIFIHRFGCQVRFFHLVHQGPNGYVVHLRQGQVADDGKNPLVQRPFDADQVLNSLPIPARRASH